MPTATTTPRRSRKPAQKTAARSVVKSRPIAKSATRPADKSVPGSGPTAAEIKQRYRRMRARLDPAKAYTEAHDRFHALPLKERKRILKEQQAEMKQALAGVMTLDDYLAERRREAERDA